ncbi:hypothetical protein AC369_09695 [Salmonella enterica subsp. diarizonae]|nr:hypothetical protein [Salmonella enterica subsp. diarizonae]EBK6837799.1 hypothetical protein [Salmonella enterica]EDR3234993.1 hypothetical protein [Salmonella enterica subsp. diarizonae]
MNRSHEQHFKPGGYNSTVSSRGTRIDGAILANFVESIVSGFRTGIVSGVEVLTAVITTM